MSNKAKNNSLLFLISAVVIIFIIAIIYKNAAVDNSEVITVVQPQTITVTKSKNKKEYDFTDTAALPTQTSESEDIYAHLSKEEKIKKISASRNKYTLYRTPEQVLEVIYQLKALGREEEAEEYIDFLVKRFPDYEMK